MRYEVVHWISGRIRLRMPRLAHDRKFAQRLADALTGLPALKQVSINERSASVVVEYRTEPMPVGGNRAVPGDATER